MTAGRYLGSTTNAFVPILVCCASTTGLRDSDGLPPLVRPVITLSALIVGFSANIPAAFVYPHRYACNLEGGSSVSEVSVPDYVMQSRKFANAPGTIFRRGLGPRFVLATDLSPCHISFLAGANHVETETFESSNISGRHSRDFGSPTPQLRSRRALHPITSTPLLYTLQGTHLSSLS